MSPVRCVGWVVAASLLACGDDGGGDGASTGPMSGDDMVPLTGVDSSGSTSMSADGTGSTDATGGDALTVDPGASMYAFIGESVTLDGSGSTGVATYTWDPGDGSGPGPAAATPTFEVTYDTPGRYQAVLTVRDDAGAQLSASIVVTATQVPTHVPVHSATIVPRVDAPGVAVVSPDTDEIVLVGPVDGPGGYGVQQRLATCDRPRTLARTATGWAVACQDDDAVQVFGDVPGLVALPRGSRPYGVIAVGEELWVSLGATGRLARIDVSADPTLVAEHEALPDPRGLARMPDGRIAVSRWRSPDDEAQIAFVDPLAPPDTPAEIVTLQFDPQAASDTESGGVPSYLDQILVSPIGHEVVIGSLQANLGQGEYLDGNPLTFETTVRGIVSYLELSGGTAAENFSRRKHFDNRGLMSAGVLSSRGDWLYLAGRGSRAVERIDMFTGGQSGTLLDVGYAPSGLALQADDDDILYVDAFMSRHVAIYDVSDFSDLPQPLALVSIVDAEPLPADVLRGKQLFNDSFDPRLAKDGYIACAHCHLDGESDHRTWDFTDRGEGLRNTISLLGRGGVAHGPIHWSANFDEVQDFEHDIRGPFGGVGLMADADWQTGTVSETLGDPKAGLSADLDALAAYVASLDTFPRSPARNPDGSLTAEAVAGQALFESPALGCTTCHAGAAMTDSQFVAPADPLLHDVGTLTAASGQRLGGPLLGLDTPTLRGLFNDAPYLHDGSAATLADVLAANVTDAHGVTSGLTPTERDQLVAYLRSLE